MQSSFKNGSLLVLAVTAIACSRATFAFIHDPEGPNLVVIIGMAVLIYVISAAIYLSNFAPSLARFKRTSVTIFIQIFVAAGFYLGLR